jgi:hypothetical protein
MEARIVPALSLCAFAVLSMGAGYRTQNFIVSAPTPQLATEIGQAAEDFRAKLAVEWLGRELPPWPQACPIEAQVAPHLGAGGATSFVFIQNQPRDWTMSIQGSRERVLDSVLPHEITHTIFATHFGRPLPRWADEGACTTVEHSSEKMKQEQNLIVFLKSSRGIAFNKMFAMKEYPKDILPLYSQGFSLARFLIQQGGKRKYVDYVGEGMQTNDWNGVTRKHYGFQDLSDLQVSWLAWVKQGSPTTAIAAATTPDSVTGETRLAAVGADLPANALPIRQGAAPTEKAASVSYASDRATKPSPAKDATDRAARPAATGWYTRMKDAAASGSPVSIASPVAAVVPVKANPIPANEIPQEPREAAVPSQSVSRPQALEPARQVILEWSRRPGETAAR